MGQSILAIRNHQLNQKMAETGHKQEWNSIKHKIFPEFQRVIKQFTADNKSGLKPARDDPKYRVVGVKVTIY